MHDGSSCLQGLFADLFGGEVLEVLLVHEALVVLLLLAVEHHVLLLGCWLR